jgi:hypothetical protein
MASVSINEYTKRGPDHQLLGERLAFQVGRVPPFGGIALPQDYLAHLVAVDSAQVVLATKAGTTVEDTASTNGADTGYTAELKIDLRSLGYPSGLGDDRLFLGVNHLDGDSYTAWQLSYGTRTWWFREYEGTCCPTWAYLRHAASTAVEPVEVGPREGYALLGNFPNPAIRQRIQFSLKEASRVDLEIYDVAGRLVENRSSGDPGFRCRGGVLRRTGEATDLLLSLADFDPETGAPRTALHGRMILLE